MKEPTVLQSWKEIAQYLNRGVRTVQRWEQYFGLPVHRPASRLRSAVFALKRELDDWMSHVGTHVDHRRPSDSCEQLLAELSKLHTECERLRAECGRLRAECDRLQEVNDPPKAAQPLRLVS